MQLEAVKHKNEKLARHQVRQESGCSGRVKKYDSICNTGRKVLRLHHGAG